MKYIFGMFFSLFMYMIALLLNISFQIPPIQKSAADDLKSCYINEIENSDFNSSVINTCISDASTKGYTLNVNTVTYDSNNNINMAKVVLTYHSKVPLLGIDEEKQVQGIAR